MIDFDELERLEELEKAATPGPWGEDGGDIYRTSIDEDGEQQLDWTGERVGPQIFEEHERGYETDTDWAACTGGKLTYEDIFLFVALRNAAKDLITMARERQVMFWQKRCGWMCGVDDHPPFDPRDYEEKELGCPACREKERAEKAEAELAILRGDIEVIGKEDMAIVRIQSRIEKAEAERDRLLSIMPFSTNADNNEASRALGEVMRHSTGGNGASVGVVEVSQARDVLVQSLAVANALRVEGGRLQDLLLELQYRRRNPGRCIDCTHSQLEGCRDDCRIQALKGGE